MTALPTRHEEAWRYSDVAAAGTVWPGQSPERIDVAAGERLRRHIINTATSDQVTMQHLVLDVRENAQAQLDIFNAGGRLGRIVVDVSLHEGADFLLNAVQLGAGRQTIEIITTIRHLAPGATSRQNVRSVAAGNGTVNYLGKIYVAPHAQKTDAVQSSKALLLARTASVNTKPELEIYADDVKCAHGATVGELDKQALFYCAARGMDPATTRILLIHGFIASVLDAVAEDDARAQMQAAAEQWLMEAHDV